MQRKSVELCVGGQTYRVVSTAEPKDLQRLAAIVDDRLSLFAAGGRSASIQSMLLAAISLAHELEEERARSRVTLERSREALERVLERVDLALQSEPEPDTNGPASE